MSDPGQDQHIADEWAGRGRTPRPAHPNTAALLDRLADRAADELDTAELTVAGGDTVQIVCLSEVTSWIRGCAVRARAGAPL